MKNEGYLYLNVTLLLGRKEGARIGLCPLKSAKAIESNWFINVT